LADGWRHDRRERQSSQQWADVASWVADDSDGNGIGDILWQNDNGQTAMWLMDGTMIVGGATLADNGTSWR
jgi:hypothetical protein